MIGYAVGSSASGIAVNAAGLGLAATQEMGHAAALSLFAGVAAALRLTRTHPYG